MVGTVKKITIMTRLVIYREIKVIERTKMVTRRIEVAYMCLIEVMIKKVMM